MQEKMAEVMSGLGGADGDNNPMADLLKVGLARQRWCGRSGCVRVRAGFLSLCVLYYSCASVRPRALALPGHHARAYAVAFQAMGGGGGEGGDLGGDKLQDRVRQQLAAMLQVRTAPINFGASTTDAAETRRPARKMLSSHGLQLRSPPTQGLNGGVEEPVVDVDEF